MEIPWRPLVESRHGIHLPQQCVNESGIDWVIGHVTELNLQPLSPPQRSGWYHLFQASNNMVGLSSKDSPHPETIKALIMNHLINVNTGLVLGTHHE